MKPKEFYNHPSVQHEISRFKKLGGKVKYKNDKIILHSGIIPVFIAEVFANRIKALDFYGVIEIIVK